MLPFGVTILSTLPQRSENTEGLMNYPVYHKTVHRKLKVNDFKRILFIRCNNTGYERRHAMRPFLSIWKFSPLFSDLLQVRSQYSIQHFVSKAFSPRISMPINWWYKKKVSPLWTTHSGKKRGVTGSIYAFGTNGWYTYVKLTMVYKSGVKNHKSKYN
jgi:hypothetical protein